ncbi:MAG TPA: zinc-binding alcohol dehydrogenase [Pilimelia sp.]|nr:zinc-binding alcohol dehydrogenase [Pilimelia sp.]
MARGVLFTAPRRVEIVDVTLPSPVPADHLVVRTRYSGISAGTEMLAYRGELDAAMAVDETLGSLPGSFRYPFAFGYSCVGEVDHGTAGVPEGTPVFAFHPHQDRFVVPETDVIPLDPGTDLRIATLFPLVETALQLTLDAGPVVEETAVVVGLGAVGLLTALLLRRAGARVIAAEPRPWRRETAASLGITALPPADLPARVADATGGRGAPLLVEVSGAPAALADGLALLAHEGTALVGSWYGTKPVPLPLGGHFHRGRITVRSSQVSTIPAALRERWDVPRRRAVARDLLGELPLAALATSDFAFEDAADAYAAIDRGEAGLIHAALRYE